MSEVTYETFSRAYKTFQALRSEDIEFDVKFDNEWNGQEYSYEFWPEIKNLDTLRQLGAVFGFAHTPITTSRIKTISGVIKKLIAKPTTEKLAQIHEKRPAGTVKYFCSAVLDKIPNLKSYLITGVPAEEMHEKQTYRIVTAAGSDKHGRPTTEIVACVDQEHPIYNYLDQNHCLFFVEPKVGSKDLIILANQMTLDVNYLVILYSLHPGTLKEVLQNEVFINAQNPGLVRLAVARAEKALPERYQDQYRAYKNQVLADFEKNAQNVLMGKLARKEIGSIMLNECKITATSGTYETISIEAADFRDVVFKAVDPNQEWDIFELIRVYCNHVEEGAASDPFETIKDDAGNDKLWPRIFKFKVNGIEITVTTSLKSLRRKVNGWSINKAEVGKVLHRASCHHEQADFDAFVKQVSRMSLFLTDVLATGLPVRTYLFDSDGYNQVATKKHPKLRFMRDKHKFHLQLAADTFMPVKSIMEFIKKVNSASRRATHETPRTHEGKYDNRKCSTCERELKTLIPQYVEGATEEQITTMLKEIMKEREDAEGRSAKLLQDVSKMVGAVREQKNGIWGWKVEGKLKTYFIEEESLRTHDYATDKYICIVSGKGDQGVGHDALVTRMLSLKNDSRVTHKITTLH